MNAPRLTPAQQTVQRMTALVQRRDDISQRVFRAQAAHEQSAAALAAAREAAQQDFGTSNVDELRQQYASINDENQAKLRKFDEDLTNVEQEMTDINNRVSADTAGA